MQKVREDDTVMLALQQCYLNLFCENPLEIANALHRALEESGAGIQCHLTGEKDYIKCTEVTQK